ncbi:MAG TPA: hypothetical protein VF714_05075 [Jatrophihabitans sp.]
MVKLQPRSRTVLAWSLWLVSFGCCAAGLVVELVGTRPLTAAGLAEGAAFALSFPLGYATVGLVLGLRRPANPIGWLFAASGLLWSLWIPWDVWIGQLFRAGRPLPLAAQLAAVTGEFSWASAIALGITLPALLLPDGRLRSRRWRVVVATAVFGATVAPLAGSLMPGQLQETDVPFDNPFGLGGAAGTAASVLTLTAVVLHWLSLVAALASLGLRFRSSVGVERQQLRWVAAGAALTLVGLLAGAFVAAAGYAAVLCVPVAVAVAVLRYRLWDLDRLVSRTVTYALVTGLLVLPYLLVVPAAGRLAAGTGSLGVAAATLVAVAAFAPLRRRVQALVDRRFNRRRYDAARTMAAFSTRLRQQIDLDTLTAELMAVVDQTMQPTQASLWLRPSEAPGAAG